MKRVAFLLPYFGKFNNYFQLFLDSCGKNNNYDWIIFTDDKRKFNYPENVIVHYTSFEDIVEFVKNKFPNINISIKNPFKFCDLRPMFGYIFEEYLVDYKYWGHCDNDLIFGRIDDFINIDSLQEFDKIGFLGHMSLFKNEYDNNRMFMKTNRYIDVLENSNPFKFDEEFNNSINNIYIQNEKKIYMKEHYADIYVKSSNFKITHFIEEKNIYVTDKKDKSFYIWCDGILSKYKYNRRNKKYEKINYLYIHLQKRQMNVNINVDYYNGLYKIIPNSFDYLECDINEIDKKYIRIKHFNLHYFRIRTKNLLNKIKLLYKDFYNKWQTILK